MSSRSGFGEGAVDGAEGAHIIYVTADPGVLDGEVFIEATERFVRAHPEGLMVRRLSPHVLVFRASGIDLVLRVRRASRVVMGVEISVQPGVGEDQRGAWQAEGALMEPPGWVLRLFPAPDAARYRLEWQVHLSERRADGEYRCARRDRRRLVFKAPGLALELWVKAFVRRLRKQVR